MKQSAASRHYPSRRGESHPAGRWPYEETQETLALLKVLALANRKVEEGKLRPAADTFARIRKRLSDKELTAIGLTEYRERHHKPKQMIYRMIGTDVVVYCVVDGHRDMQAFLERRLIR
ncbi:hypothetical protein [Rhizobium binae]|uniref:hypothetical protein n=1 Tax=Rhizobium binae TaxID=1138190 RepID=UPI002180C6D5|nr:hypothetical protein [Rhizobium binae]